ncbi:hypothetical protein HYFRA_00011052 [Hymenoscyphus fraxineus]|uniref:AB hydrolase-1 domain-containing protein n=1 Tax=Hymenoscyphus fraxineus TaxID=746836 RepID=A0A9N9L1B6_9HELO|nr:hypothetical protein HYFRA_00011052 [Hymenoscyphus fraxineus]
MVGAAETHSFDLPGGRSVSWSEYGTKNSPHPPIIFLHSSPSSRYEGESLHAAALSLNLRVISPDRPGIGLSSPEPNRTFLTYPADILALTHHLHVERFRMLSLSGGAPYLLACMRRIPREVLLGGHVVSGVWPMDLGTEGMDWMRRGLMFMAHFAPTFVGSMMNYQIGSAARDPDTSKLEASITAQANNWPKPDQEAWKSGKVKKYMMQGLREAFRDGGTGVGLEMGLYAKDWGFDLESVDTRGLKIWHGKLDTTCPFEQAEKAVDCLQGARSFYYDDMAHMVIAYHAEDILREMVPVGGEQFPTTPVKSPVDIRIAPPTPTPVPATIAPAAVPEAIPDVPAVVPEQAKAEEAAAA